MIQYINSFLRLVIDFFLNSKEVLIYKGKGVIVEENSMKHIDWIDTKIRLKEGELAFIGYDKVIKSGSIKDLFNLQRNNVILHKPVDYLNYL